jgi:hypothetical protein
MSGNGRDERKSCNSCDEFFLSRELHIQILVEHLYLSNVVLDTRYTLILGHSKIGEHRIMPDI